MLLVACLYGAGCGDATSGAEGIVCDTDSDCMGGLRCLNYWVVVDGGCASEGTLCVQLCQTDSDCATGASAGLGLTCFSSCGGTATCEAPVASPDGGPEAASEAASD